MPPSSRKGKKKSKSKQNGKKAVATSQSDGHGLIDAELYHEDGDYPSSRVIKRAPNGDVIVESLPVDDKRKDIGHTDDNLQQSPMAFTLDSHWESLTSEEKKNILRIEKNEVFDVIRKYQNNHSCNCSVCGRRHMAMDQEMERIYNTLYELDKDRDPEINPVKFHLSIIKELQDSKSQQQHQVHREQQKKIEQQEQEQQQQVHQQQQVQLHNLPELEKSNRQENSQTDYENMRDEVVKFFLSSNAVDSLKEEVMHFKESKQRQQQHPQHHRQQPHQQHKQHHQQRQQHLHKHHHQRQHERDHENANHQTLQEGQKLQDNPTNQADNQPDTVRLPIEEHTGNSHLLTPVAYPNAAYDTDNPSPSVDAEGLQGKYLNFAKTFVSSHPKIAQEYVNRMMMYPDMRELTDDLMNNNGQGFIQAVEGFVLEQQSQKDPNQLQQLIGPNDADITQYQHLGNAKEFTTMLHNGTPLTEEEYINLQRQIAQRMTNCYDTQKKEFKEVSQLERELFIRFMFGEDRKSFGDLIMQAFKEKFNDDYGTAAIGASLAAAAAATSASMKIPGSDETDADYDYDDPNDDGGAIDSGEYDDHFDDYSGYDHEEDEDFENEEEYDVRSDLNEENSHGMTCDCDDDGDQVCSHSSHEEANCKNYGHVCGKSELRDDVHNHRHHHHHHHHHHQHVHEDYAEEGEDEEDEDDDEEDEEEEEYDSGLDESDRLEEGRKLIQIAITKLLQGRIMESYHEKQAENNRLKLLQELEAEELKKKAKEEKKQKKREKEREKKRLQQQAKEEEIRKRDEEAKAAKKEAEEREKQRREAQRKKVEETKRKKDEERRRKLEEQRRREEEQERQRKLKEEQKRKRDEEKRLKEEERRLKEEEKRRKEEEKRKKEEIKKKETDIKQNEEDKKNRQKQMRGGLPQELAKNTGGSLLGSAKNNPQSISTMLPENAYGDTRHTRSNATLDNNINQEFFSLVNAASNSRTSSSMGEFHKLMQIGNGISNQEEPNKSILPGSSLFGSSNVLPSLDALSNIEGQISPVQPPAAGLNNQAYNISSWDGFLNTGITNDSSGGLRSSQQVQQAENQNLLQQQKVQEKQYCSIAPSLGLSSSDPNGGNTFEEEMNSLTSMLTSAGLGSSRTTHSFSQTPLWGSGAPQNSMNMVRNGASAAGTQVAADATTGATAGPRSSIWEAPIGGPDVTTMANGIDSATSQFPASNIWSPTAAPSSVPFLDSHNVAPSNGNQLGNATKLDPAGSSFLMGNIYNTYSAFAAAQDPSLREHYVSANLLHQNSVCDSMDYSTFVNYLLNMRSSHGCELLTNETGTVTHTKMVLGLPQSSLSQFSGNVTNTMYPTSSDAKPMNAALSQGETLPQSGSLGSGLKPNAQLYNIGQRPNASLVSNIWG